MRAQASRLKNANKNFDWTRIFSLLVMGLAPVSSVFWFFIPVATSLILQSTQKPLRFLTLVSALATLSSPLWFPQRQFTQLDALGLVLLFLMGVVSAHLRSRKVSFLNYLLWPTPLCFLLAFILYGISSKELSLVQWAEQELQSELFPYLFQAQMSGSAVQTEVFQLIVSVFKKGILAWFGVVMGMAFFVNSLMENLLKSFRASNLRGQARVFDRFNRWKAPEWVLIPLVLSLGMLAISGFKDLQAWSGQLSVYAWNFSVLSLFPIFLQGIAVSAFFITRLGIFLSLVLFMGLLFFPLPILMLAGLLDLWLDLRSKFELKGP